jgi:hypothetical protein
MRPRFRILLAVLLICTCLIVAAVAWGAETLTFHASFTPDELGASTNFSATGRFGSTTPGLPSPVSEVKGYLPAGVKIDVHGAGTCTAATLEEDGPTGCPADSRAGFGGGVGLLELAKEIIHEPFTVDIFLGPSEDGHLVFLTYVDAVSPAVVELVLKAKEIAAPKPYGLGFSVEVPPIPTLPGASDASVESAFLTFGSKNVAYYETVHGKRKLLHVKGIVIPKTCPHGGFPVQGDIAFADGTTTTANTTIPCPHS